MEYKYTFEYSNNKLIERIGLLFLALLVLFFVLFINQGQQQKLWFFLMIVVAIFGFLFLKQNAKLLGTCIMDLESIEFNINDLVYKTKFADIVEFKIVSSPHCIIKIVNKSGEKFNLTANSNFCDNSGLLEVCRDFELAIQNFKAFNQLSINRKKSIFEYKTILYVLIFLSIVYSGIMSYCFLYETSITSSAYTSFAGLIGLWSSYYYTKKYRTQIESSQNS